MKTTLLLSVSLAAMLAGEPDPLTDPRLYEAPGILEHFYSQPGDLADEEWREVRPGNGMHLRIPYTWSLLEDVEEDAILPGEILASYSSPEGDCKLSVSVIKNNPLLVSIFGRQGGEGLELLGYDNDNPPQFRRLTVDGRPAVLISAHGTHCYSLELHEPFEGYNQMLLVLMPGYVLNVRVSHEYAKQPHNIGQAEYERRVSADTIALGERVMRSIRLNHLPGMSSWKAPEPLKKFTPWTEVETEYGISYRLPVNADVHQSPGFASGRIEASSFSIRYKDARLRTIIYLYPPSMARSTKEHAESLEKVYDSLEPQWRAAFKVLLENSFMDETDRENGAVLDTQPTQLSSLAGHTALVSSGSVLIPPGAGHSSSLHWRYQIWTEDYLFSMHTYLLYNAALPVEETGRVYLEEVQREFLRSISIEDIPNPFPKDTSSQPEQK